MTMSSITVGELTDILDEIEFEYEVDYDEDEPEQLAVAIERAVMLYGGVSREHIVETFYMWAAILIRAQEFFEGPTVVAEDSDEPED